MIENSDTYISSGKTIVVALDEFDSLLVKANSITSDDEKNMNAYIKSQNQDQDSLNIYSSSDIYLFYFSKLLDLASSWPDNKLKVCLLGATLPTSLIEHIKSIMDNEYLEIISTERVAKNIICKDKNFNDHPFQLREINANVLRTLPSAIRRRMFIGRIETENTNDPGFNIRDAYLDYQKNYSSSSNQEIKTSTLNPSEAFEIAKHLFKIRNNLYY